MAQISTDEAGSRDSKSASIGAICGLNQRFPKADAAIHRRKGRAG
jgi:hypothetical protein